jgi:iron complex outermembrane recepter protein
LEKPRPGDFLERLVVEAEEEKQDAPITLDRMEVPVLDDPRSVQTLSSELIELQGVRDIQEAVKNVSGVTRSSSFVGFGENYILRGFVQQDLFKDGFRAGGVSNSNLVTVGTTDIAGVSQVEILKGPAAILFGRGEPGGVVNYVTNKAEFVNEFSIEQQAGSHGFLRSVGSMNWEANPGKFALRLDGSLESGGSFLYGVSGERQFIAPAFTWAIGEDTTLTFRSEYLNETRNTDPGVPIVGGRILPGIPYGNYLGEPSFTEYDNESFRGLMELDHRWNDEHRSKLSLHGRKGSSEGAYFILFNFAGPTYDPTTGNISRSLAQSNFEDENLAARIDHVWETDLAPDVRNQLLVSAEYETETRDNFRNLSGHAPINVFNPVYTVYSPTPLLPFPGFPLLLGETSGTEADALSLLVMDRISFGEKVHLSFGGRIERFKGETFTSYPPGSFPSSNRPATEETTFNPSAGIVYKPMQDLSIYASYASSTNSFTNLRRITATGDKLDAETACQFEIGTKMELLDGNLVASAAVFQIEKSDVAGTDPANPLFSINAGEERSRGIEADLRYEPIAGLNILANYAFIDASIESDPTGVTTGNRRYGVPRHSGGLFAVYEMQDGPAKGLGIGGGVYASDKVEISNGNIGTLPGFHTVDALIYYKKDDWTARLNVNNLFDEEYYYSTGNAQAAGRGTARTFVASLKYEF